MPIQNTQSILRAIQYVQKKSPDPQVECFIYGIHENEGKPQICVGSADRSIMSIDDPNDPEWGNVLLIINHGKKIVPLIRALRNQLAFRSELIACNKYVILKEKDQVWTAQANDAISPMESSWNIFEYTCYFAIAKQLRDREITIFESKSAHDHLAIIERFQQNGWIPASLPILKSYQTYSSMPKGNRILLRSNNIAVLLDGKTQKLLGGWRIPN